MLSIGPLAFVAIYGAALVAIVVVAQAIVRISRAVTRISSSLDEIAAAIRTGSRS
jgi:hypothetical protein